MRTASKTRVPAPGEFGYTAVVAVVLVLGMIGAAELQEDRARPLDFLAFTLIVLTAVATVLPRRRAPVVALTLAMVTLSGYLLAGYPYGPVQLCMVVTMFEVARQRPLRVSALVCGVAAVAASAVVTVRVAHEVDNSPLPLSVAWMGWIVLPWSLGALVHAVTGARERSRKELIARVALEERMKIAAEVHDIAGHGFAVVAMQAGVALLVYDEQPGQVRKSLEAIQSSSAASLSELRSLLDTFRPDGPARAGVPGHAVDAGLARLDELVEQVRAGGLRVEVDVERLDDTLTEDVDAVAYRVVQESLTNVLRHAGETTANVGIARQEDELVVRVTDRGRGVPAGTLRPGRGLTGMRGRVEDVGGRLETGPCEDGGFRVVAYLPLGGDR